MGNGRLVAHPCGTGVLACLPVVSCATQLAHKANGRGRPCHVEINPIIVPIFVLIVVSLIIVVIVVPIVVSGSFGIVDRSCGLADDDQDKDRDDDENRRGSGQGSGQGWGTDAWLHIPVGLASSPVSRSSVVQRNSPTRLTGEDARAT